MAIAFILVPATLIAVSPSGTKVIKADKDDVFFLQELGALIMQDGGAIRIDFVAPADSRAKKYRSVDVESGDVIMMLDGKRVESVKVLRRNYEEAESGEVIKLGLKREQRMMIVEFPKADPEDVPQGKMMMVTMDGDGEGTVTTTSGPDTKVIKMEAGSAANATLLELGVLFGEKEGKVIVTSTLPHSEDVLGMEVANGDILRSLQGETVSTLDEFAETYESIAVGDTVRLVFQRSGEEISAAFPRPESPDGLTIERKR